jgi:hypothetical protein
MPTISWKLLKYKRKEDLFLFELSGNSGLLTQNQFLNMEDSNKPGGIESILQPHCPHADCVYTDWPLLMPYRLGEHSHVSHGYKFYNRRNIRF